VATSIDFSKREFKGVEFEIIDDVDVLTISDPHNLTQISGYIRFAASPGRTYFRGESSLHTTILPSLLRDGPAVVTARSLETRSKRIQEYIDDLSGSQCTCTAHNARRNHRLKYHESHRCDGTIPRKPKGSLVPGTYRAAIEPLLQHYGIRTRWLDLVDNIWIALWFACHEQKTEYEATGALGRYARAYAYHLRRSPFKGPQAKPVSGSTQDPSAETGDRSDAASQPESLDDAYAYVYMFSTGRLSPTAVPGYEISEDHRLVDLRYATPSVYLRPHAQHGLLIANRAMPGRNEEHSPETLSLNSALSGVIRIKLGDALDWLGEGVLTDVFNLFPPAYSDLGYRKLLAARDSPTSIGAITNYQGGI